VCEGSWEITILISVAFPLGIVTPLISTFAIQKWVDSHLIPERWYFILTLCL
jgi:hypothetical protein